MCPLCVHLGSALAAPPSIARHVSALSPLWPLLQTLCTMCPPCVCYVPALCPPWVRFSRASKDCPPCVRLEFALAASPNLGRHVLAAFVRLWSVCSPWPRLCLFCVRSCPPQSRSLYRAWLCLCLLFVWSPLPAVLLSALKLRRAFVPCLCLSPLSGFSVFV